MKAIAVLLLFTVLTPGPADALDCPKIPEQARKDLQIEVKAAVVRIGPVRGAELETATKAVTQDLLGKLPQADKVYLEQMMYATYCSALRDDKTISEGEKASRIKAYNLEVRRTLQAQPPKAPTTSGGEKRGALTPLDARNELAKLALPYSPEAFVKRSSEGDLVAVKLYLAAGMNVDVSAIDRGELPATALMRAAEKGHVEVVNLLLNAKADVNKTTGWGGSAMSSAVIPAKSDVLRVLLDKGVSAENINYAFVVAASWGRAEALRLLLKKGADIKKVGAEALTEAVRASPYRGRSEQAMTETIGLLLDSGVDVNTRDKSHKPVLHIAANDGFLAVTKTLLDRGADINARDNEGATALWWTAGIGNRDATILLIERGADVNAKADDGTTALWRAKYNNDKELIAFLTGRGAE